MNIVSYKINKEVVICNFEDVCYGIVQVIRGDNVKLLSLRGPDRPIHMKQLAMNDATKLTLSPEIDKVINNLQE